MKKLLDLVAARRAEIDAELREIEDFLDRAEELLAGRFPTGIRPAATAEVTLPANVIPFPPRVREPGTDATACGTGA